MPCGGENKKENKNLNFEYLSDLYPKLKILAAGLVKMRSHNKRFSQFKSFPYKVGQQKWEIILFEIHKWFGRIWELCVNTSSSVGFVHILMYLLVAAVLLTDYCLYKMDTKGNKIEIQPLCFCFEWK